MSVWAARAPALARATVTFSGDVSFPVGSGVFGTINGDGPLFTPNFDPADVTLVAN